VKEGIGGMNIYNPMIGNHIVEVINRCLTLAAQADAPYQFTFNEIDVVVQPIDSVNEVFNRWQAEMTRRTELYWASPQGVKVLAEQAAELYRHQVTHDRLMRQLNEVVNNEPKLLNWLAEFADATDYIGVTGKNYPLVIETIEAAGYRDGDFVGVPKKLINDHRKLARYIVGQTINCMNSGFGPHPVTGDFVKQYHTLCEQSSIGA
jgi:hypothetical protein